MGKKKKFIILFIFIFIFISCGGTTEDKKTEVIEEVKKQLENKSLSPTPQTKIIEDVYNQSPQKDI